MKIQWKKGADLRDEKGVYAHKGRAYLSVTTALGPFDDFIFVHTQVIAKYVAELVLAAKNKQMVEAMTEVVDTETGEVSYCLMPRDPVELLLEEKHIKNAGFRYMKQCADRGSVIHDILADYARGDNVDDSQIEEKVESLIFGQKRACKPEQCIPYAKQLIRFLDDKRPTVLMSEMPVFNDEYEYAGTMDGVMIVDGEMFAVDLKTGKSWKRSWGAQIAAYSRALFGVEECGLETPIPTELKCATLQTTEDAYNWRPVDYPEIYFDSIFLPALKATKAARELQMPTRGQRSKEVAA